MKNKHAMCVAIWCGALVLKAMSQSQPEVALENPQQIQDAGKSGDKLLIVRLKKIFKLDELSPKSRSGSAEMALAKLGDENAMKAIVCELNNNENVAQQTDAFEKLHYVAGYTSIQVLSRFLDNNPQYSQSRMLGRDNVAESLGQLARDTITAIVPGTYHPPKHWRYGTTVEMKEWNREWVRWIRDNDSKLKKLEPVFSFKTVSRAECQDIEQKRKESDTGKQEN